MSFSIEEAKKTVEKYEKLVIELLISGLLPVIGVLITATEIKFYSIPILITIVIYLYKVIGIIMKKEKNVFLMLVIKEEETERTLGYFKWVCIPIICISIISYLLAQFPKTPLERTIPLGFILLHLEGLSWGPILLIFISAISPVYLWWYEIKLGLKRRILPLISVIFFSTHLYYYKIRKFLFLRVRSFWCES